MKLIILTMTEHVYLSLHCRGVKFGVSKHLLQTVLKLFGKFMCFMSTTIKKNYEIVLGANIKDIEILTK